MSLEEFIVGLLTALGYYVLWLNARWEDAQYMRRHMSSVSVRPLGSGLTNHSQKSTVAASASAEK